VADDGSLSRTQRRAIAALLTNRTIEDASTQSGVSQRSIYRWLQDPAFRVALAGAEGDAIDEAVRSLVVDLAVNHQTMQAIRDDPDNSAGVRLRAAATLDASLLRWRELRDIEGRLTKLEAALLDDA